MKSLGRELQSKYFSVNQESTRRVAAELKAILSSVEAACLAHDNDSVSTNPIIAGDFREGLFFCE